MDQIQRSPRQIFGTYLLIGSIYIITSDYLVSLLWPTADNLQWVQTAKGLVFVLVTGLLLLYYLNRKFQEISRMQQEQNNVICRLEESEQEKTIILNAIQERAAFMDSSFRILWANRAAGESLGMKANDLKGLHCYELWYEREEPCLDCPVAESIQEGYPHEAEIVTPDGRSWYLRGYPVRDSQGQVIGVVKFGEDITKQKVMEIELEESERRFRELVEVAPDAIFMQLDGKFEYLNPAAIALFEAESPTDLLGKPVLDRFHPHYREIVQERIKSLNIEKQPVSWLEEIYLTMDDRSVPVEVKAVPTRYQGKDGALVYVRNLTERKRQDAARLADMATRRQQQKMEEIGMLASGVAHEINNPINGIINYAQLISEVEALDSNSRHYADEIIAEAERIASIVKDLLQFARHEKHAHSYASFQDIIQRTLNLMQASLRKDNITLDLDIPTDLPQIKCRSQQIQQVLLNLISNARLALNDRYPQGNENKILRIDARLAVREDRKWLIIGVEDKGLGIPKAMQSHVFNPFFTTRGRAQGTGLGLPISYGIVKDHHGSITFQSVENQFTRFIVELPVDNGWEMEADSD